jgi:GNAT superfamily N-acetyltransferase
MIVKMHKHLGIPEECSNLVLPNGTMQFWFSKEREDMVAAVAYNGRNEPVAWCAYVPVKVDFFTGYKIGVFVKHEYRRQRIGVEVLRAALSYLRLKSPKGSPVLYGVGHNRDKSFEKTYAREIEAAGLSPVHFFKG